LIYTHVIRQAKGDVASPLDVLGAQAERHAAGMDTLRSACTPIPPQQP